MGTLGYPLTPILPNPQYAVFMGSVGNRPVVVHREATVGVSKVIVSTPLGLHALRCREVASRILDPLVICNVTSLRISIGCGLWGGGGADGQTDGWMIEQLL